MAGQRGYSIVCHGTVPLTATPVLTVTPFQSYNRLLFTNSDRGNGRVQYCRLSVASV